LTAESGEYSEKFNEKSDTNSTKPSWRKKRLFGKIPMGVALVILILLLVFAVALGAAIGTFAAKKHGSKGNKNEHNGPEKEP
jgi:flagellar basal body-associated protein FliL